MSAQRKTWFSKLIGNPRRILVLVGGIVFTCVCGPVLAALIFPSSQAALPTSTIQAIVRTSVSTQTTTPEKPTEAPSATRNSPTATPTRPVQTKTSSAIPSTNTTTAVPPTNTHMPSTVTPKPVVLPTSIPAPVIATDTQVPQPTAPQPTTQPTGFTLVNLTSPISAGSNANITIQTAPSANCFLGYTTPSGNPSTAQGLGAITADGNGICSWTWKIGSSTNPGTGSLAVTANGMTQYFQIVIQ